MAEIPEDRLTISAEQLGINEGYVLAFHLSLGASTAPNTALAWILASE